MLLLEVANRLKDNVCQFAYKITDNVKEIRLMTNTLDRAKEMSIFRKRLEKSIKATIDRQKPEVLLLGPKMDGEGDSSRLRRELKERLWGLGLPVYAEHAEMVRAAKKGFKSCDNLSRLELHIAHIVQLIILIPDSPGSFAELGLFAHHEEISRRLVILYNKRAKGVTKSFIFLGPIKYADELKVEILPTDYRKIERVWAKIVKYIEREKTRMADSL